MDKPVHDSWRNANVKFRLVGKSLPRIDAPDKVFGKTIYAGDYVMPGMLHAKVLRSPLASAQLTRLDVSRARNLPGVACVLTSEDLPNKYISTELPGKSVGDSVQASQPIISGLPAVAALHFEVIKKFGCYGGAEIGQGKTCYRFFLPCGGKNEKQLDCIPVA